MKKPSKALIRLYEWADTNKRIYMELDFPYGMRWVIKLTDKELRQIKKGEIWN